MTDLARQGDEAAFHELLERCRPRLARMVSTRIDPRLSARVDPSDVVQDTLTQAALCRHQFQGVQPASFYAWLRGIAFNRLIDLQRHHIGAQRRSVLKEVSWRALRLNDHSSVALAKVLANPDSGPQRRIERHEMVARLQAALRKLSTVDRELLVMRHLEQMSTEEIATVLRMSRTNVSTRHLRALQRLQKVLAGPNLE
jgi:RNA polymerase sigma-70 factor (ECF subfamily)